jgi:NADPH2:quinone reductase
MSVQPPQMQALVFDGPAPDTSASRVTELVVPEPAPGAVSIDVHYAGVNFKDVMARRGDPGYVPSWPFVPGLEVAGTVHELGAGVNGLQVGDRVTAFTDHGGLAEVAVAPADLTVRVPAGLDLERAAAAPGALTTAALLLSDFGHLRPGEVVLVHSAAGGVGQAVVRLARLAGAELVLGTVGDTNRVAAAKRAGYDAALVRGPGLTSAIRECTGDRPIDLVLDPQGTSLLDLDLDVLAAGGRIVLFGNATGATLDPLPAASRLFGANASIAGFSLAALAATAAGRVAGAMHDVLDHLAAGELEVELTKVEGLDAAPQAQQALAEGRGRGKQVVRVKAT